MLFDQFSLEIPDGVACSQAAHGSFQVPTVNVCVEPMHLRCTLKTQRFPMVFNDFHVAHLARSPRSARACRGPLSRWVATGRDHGMELFIFTSLYKGISISVGF